MLNLTKGNTETIIYTASESARVNTSFFLFVFTNKMDHSEVKMVLRNTSDVSRYDKSVVVVDDHFSGMDAGVWKYKIYEEQDDINNLDTTGLNILEEGLMTLHGTDTTQTAYTGQSETFKTYGE